MTFQSMVSMFDESQKSWVDFFEKMFQVRSFDSISPSGVLLWVGLSWT